MKQLGSFLFVAVANGGHLLLPPSGNQQSKSEMYLRYLKNTFDLAMNQNLSGLTGQAGSPSLGALW